MAGFRALTPNININTTSGQLRTELLNTFTRLDGQLSSSPYRIGSMVGPVGNSTGAESTLASTTISIGTLAKQESSILIFACGKTNVNANVKTLKLKFGTAELFTTGATAFNGVDWTMNAELVRTSATTQTAWVQFFSTATLTQKVTVSTVSVDLAQNQTLTIRGEGVAANDISLYYWKNILLT
ncbi:hypothetical protein H0W80_04895 [Candidatus Saccharibacteria bacterium]|nr:hypothetical protein [Candidatus Saccharibacteria bacterium]